MYVYERKSANRRAIVIMNGNDKEADIYMSVYGEILHPGDTFTNVITGEKITIAPSMKFAPRATLLLE